MPRSQPPSSPLTDAETGLQASEGHAAFTGGRPPLLQVAGVPSDFPFVWGLPRGPRGGVGRAGWLPPAAHLLCDLEQLALPLWAHAGAQMLNVQFPAWSHLPPASLMRSGAHTLPSPDGRLWGPESPQRPPCSSLPPGSHFFLLQQAAGKPGRGQPVDPGEGGAGRTSPPPTFC